MDSSPVSPPVWQRAGWALTLIGFGACTVLLSGSNRVFLAYSAVIVSFLLLAWSGRRQGLRRPRGRIRWRTGVLLGLVVTATVVAGLVWVWYDQPWAMLALLVILPVAAFVDTLLADRRRAAQPEAVTPPV